MRRLLDLHEVLLRRAARPPAARRPAPLPPRLPHPACIARRCLQSLPRAAGAGLHRRRAAEQPAGPRARVAGAPAAEGRRLPHPRARQRRAAAAGSAGGGPRAHRGDHAARRQQRVVPPQAEAELPGLRHQRLRGPAREPRVRPGLRFHCLGARARRLRQHVLPPRAQGGRAVAAEDQHDQPHLLQRGGLQRHLLREERVRDRGGAQERRGRHGARGHGPLLPHVVLPVLGQAARGRAGRVRLHAAASGARHAPRVRRAVLCGGGADDRDDAAVSRLPPGPGVPDEHGLLRQHRQLRLLLHAAVRHDGAAPRGGSPLHAHADPALRLRRAQRPAEAPTL